MPEPESISGEHVIAAELNPRLPWLAGGIAEEVRHGEETFWGVTAYWAEAAAGATAAGAVYGLPFFLIGAVIGLIYAGVVSVVLVVPFAVCVRTMCGRWRHPLAAPAFGGTVGFLAVSFLWAERIRPAGAVIIFALGPMVTTVLGMMGSYQATRSATRELWRRRLEQDREWRLRFSIRMILAATAWIAIGLTVLQALNMLTPTMAVFTAAWLPWQSLLLWRLTRNLTVEAIKPRLQEVGDDEATPGADALANGAGSRSTWNE